MNELKEPLVSIIVITFNSAKYVLETLESAKAQTYQNIELIVSDDCSTDNTVEICRNWIDENKDRFVRTELITVEKNTGIAPNCNRGLYKADGEWVKFIAGDDYLKVKSIETYIRYIDESDEEIRLLVSDVLSFFEVVYERVFEKSNILVNPFFKLGITAMQQYKLIQNGIPFKTPGLFIKYEVFNKVGVFDERYPMIEDYPFYVKCLKNDIKFFAIDNNLVFYRMHKESVSSIVENNLFNSHYQKSYFLDRELFFEEWSSIEKISRLYKYWIQLVFDKLNLNSKKYKIPYVFLMRINILKYI